MAKRLNVERFKELLPPLSTEDFAALKADIEANGVRHPIAIDEEGNVLDGRNRYACDPKAPTIVIKGLDNDGKECFVLRSIRHRHLSPDQRREWLATCRKKAAALRKANPKRYTNKVVGRLLGVSEDAVESWFKNPNGRVAKPDARVKLSPQAQDEIAARAEKGEPVAQIAADYGVTPGRVSQLKTKKAKERTVRQQAAQQAAEVEADSGIFNEDFRTTTRVADNSIALIFTDPPYADYAIYGDLAVFAKRVLLPGALCMAYTGQHHLPRIIELMSKHLDYQWCCCCLHTGGDLRFRALHLHNKWKPILLFSKGKTTPWWEWTQDVTSGGKEKDDHEWQQSEPEAAQYIGAFCPPDGIVCEPFLGSGTTCAAAKKLGRRWIGFDVDAQAASAATRRLLTA